MARLKTLPLIVTAAAVVLTACGDAPVTPDPEEQPTVQPQSVQEYYTGPLAERWTQRSSETLVPSGPPATKKGWTPLAPVPTAVASPFAGVEGMSVAAVGNKIIAAVGFDNFVGDTPTTRIYDIASNTWSLGSNAPMSSSEGTAVSHGGLLYVIGGRVAAANALWSYDPTTDTWTVLPAMPTGRAGLAAAVVGNAIYAIGGRSSLFGPCSGSGFTELATVERFDIDAGTWSLVASLPSARSGLAAVTVGGKIYVFGGCRGFGIILADVDVYDPVTDTWSTAPTNMPTPRAGMYAAASKGGTVYVIGGWDGIGAGLATNEAYKVSKDSWSPAPPMLTARAEVGAVGHGGRIYIVGGATPGFGAAVAAMEVFKPK